MGRGLSLIVITFVVAVASAARPAEACSCAAPGLPCEALYRSTVFVGKAVKTQARDAGSAVTTFEVIEVLHSARTLARTVRVSHSTVGSMCGMGFAKGTRYVVYAGGEEGNLSVGRCSPTHRYSQSSPDVVYARSKVSRSLARVEGRVVLLDPGGRAPRAGARLRVAGTTIEATSDQRGEFALDVPPGRHQLEVISPGLRVLHGAPVAIEVPVAAACARPTLPVVWDGRITGTLRDAAGAPVANLEVQALVVAPGRQPYRLAATSAADGRYTIHEVPAGSYRVGVSPDGPTPASPYPETYASAPVRVSQAGLAADVDLALPRAMAVHALRVIALRRDGTPAAQASVTVIPAGQRRSTGGIADAQGALRVDELDGLEVTIRACYGGACAEERRTVRASGDVTLTLPI